MKRYWISFVAEDHRPVKWPLPPELIQSWCSGYDSEDNEIVCLLAQHDDEDALWRMIHEYWPETVGQTWRFWQEHNVDWTPGSRFPLRGKP
jgi:hypothetical protein